ncbi:MAG: c-type cytochrome, partial [Chloroflexota bacterium]
SLVQQSTPAEWFTMITNGNLERYMPPFSASLSDQDRWNVLSYVYRLSIADEKYELGQQIYSQNCAACHDTDGAGESAAEFTNQDFMSKLSGGQIINLIDPTLAQPPHILENDLSQDEFTAIAAYLRTYTFPFLSEADLQAGLLDIGDSAVEEPTDEEPTDEEPSDEEPSDEEPTDGEQTDPEEDPIDASQGNVSGTITFGDSADSLQAVEVILKGYDHIDEVVNLQLQSSAAGTYKFEAVPFAPGRIFFITVEHQGVTYQSEFVTAEDEIGNVEIPLNIYDTTNSPATLVASEVIFFVEFPAPDYIQIIEWYRIANQGSQTVVPLSDTQPTLNIDIPVEADLNTLVFRDGTLGEDYAAKSQGFGILSPSLPQETRDLVFGYDLPYKRKFDFQQTLTLPAGAIVVFVPIDTIQVESDQLTPAGTEDFQDLTYNVYTVPAMASGDTIQINFKGAHPLSSNNFALQVSNPTDLAIGGLAFLIAAVGVILWLREESSPGYSVETIMDQIIALEDTYGAEELSEKRYLSRRASLKGELRKAIKKNSSK